MVGESVTLKIQRDGDIEWKFEDRNILIAKISRDEITLYDKVLDGSFKGRLKLDQTGSLTITNTRTTDSGDFKTINTSTGKLLKTFMLTVYGPLPIPVISTDPTTSSESRCVLLCSVVNVSAGSLSWYKGNRVLSSTSVSDIRSRISLHLEVEYQNNTYSCVVNNPISNQTTHLDINTHCNTRSAVILLTLPVVVGMNVGVAVVTAMVTVLVYKFISRCLRRKKHAPEEAKNAYSSLNYAL
ncbi:SLAM family member 9-like isoform X2 [Danio aesculapii]|nr:SLAM family member 9-like isoform X2 [Danio aesculapii]